MSPAWRSSRRACPARRTSRPVRSRPWKKTLPAQSICWFPASRCTWWRSAALPGPSSSASTGSSVIFAPPDPRRPPPPPSPPPYPRAPSPQARGTSPITAAMAGLHQLGARRIALISPYVAAINALFRRHIEADGVQVARIASFNHANDAQVARIDRASLESAIGGAGSAADVDAVFVACTSLRMCELTRDVEQALGKPVISSNSAMAWHALRLAGIDDPLPRLPRLFEQPAGARAGGPDPGRLSQAFFLGSS